MCGFGTVYPTCTGVPLRLMTKPAIYFGWVGNLYMENSVGSGTAALDQSESMLGEDESTRLGSPDLQNVFDDDYSGRSGGGRIVDAGSCSKRNSDMEEKEEDFLIQEAARRFARSNQTSIGSGVLGESQFDDSVISRTSAQEASSTARKPWHDDCSEEHKRQMELEIASLLRNRKPSPQPEEWSNQLPYKARKLSERLYRSASSLEAFLDMNTLKKRLEKVAQEIFNEYKKKRSGARSMSRSSVAGRLPGSEPPITPSMSVVSTDSLRSLQESFNTNASFTPRNSIVGLGTSSLMPPPAPVVQNTQSKSSERSARLKEQQESIERLEAKILDEIRQQEELEKKQNANDQLLVQQRIHEENMQLARLQLQLQQQQQQQLASQSHLLSLQSFSDGMNHQLGTGSLPTGPLSDLWQSSRNLLPQGNFNSFLVQQTGTTPFSDHLRTQHLLLQQQQQQQQQQRLSISGLESFAEQQRLQNELRMLAMANGSSGTSVAQQNLVRQLSNSSNGPSNSMQQDDAPLSPDALDRFWDER